MEESFAKFSQRWAKIDLNCCVLVHLLVPELIINRKSLIKGMLITKIIPHILSKRQKKEVICVKMESASTSSS